MDAAGAGNEIECPTCGASLVIPDATPNNLSVINPISVSAGAKMDKHFSVPQRTAGDVLIKKPKPTLEVAAKDTDKKIRVKTIRHGDCVEVGKDKFDDVVTEFLQKIGQENIISLTPINYSHTDAAGRQLVDDFGVMIVFKG